MTDRNLLFGILALQNHLVDREQLVSAMRLWLSDKTRAIEEVLVEQQAIDEEERQLLTALVAKHLAKHENHAEKSLQALSTLATSVRQELVDLRDEQLEASLARVAADSDATVTFQAPSASERVRFRVIRKHARGGLGEVFVATDEELHREVALKQIQESHADNPESRARFMVEAELTGGLEHPGIVPVYGLGQYDDGRPFYAMRFIRGDSLREAIASFHRADQGGMPAGERSLQLRKLLGRFIDVCDAVGYAHSRGVLHRDLKPGNVMLGKHGETLVVDWGLAKVFDGEESKSIHQEPRLKPASGSGSDATRMGSAIGTPAYMSPEQATGRLDLLDVHSDVYSLGATLYSLLTGEPPVQGEDQETTLRKVAKGDFPRPRQVSAKVPAALEAICLKAMSLQPVDRYPTPRSLAEDVEHWLADEPVSAYSDPWLSRMARWSRHHKVAVVTLLVLLCTGLVSASIGAAMLANANQRIRAEQLRAEESERIANENFQLARSAVDDYLTTVGDEVLLDEPGMQPLRRELLTTALQYYQQFVEQRADDPGAQADLAAAYLRMGAIVEKIGSVQDAVTAYQQAMEVSQALLEASPDDPPRRLNLAICHANLATAFHGTGRYDEATHQYEQVVSLVEPLLDDPELRRRAQLELAQVYNLQGAMLSDQGKTTEALEIYRRGESLVRDLLEQAEDPGDDRTGAQDTLARSLYNQAILKRETGELDSSLELYQNAIAIREQMIASAPEVQHNHSKLALCFTGMANSLSDLGRQQEALQLNNRILAIRERLAEENPAVTYYHEQLSSAFVSLATTERRLGNLAEAAESGRKANEILLRLTETHPKVVSFRSLLALNYYNLGNLFLRDPVAQLNNTDEAILREQCKLSVEQYLQSIAVYESLVQDFPDQPEFHASLATAYNNCGSAYHLLGEAEKSQKAQEQAMTLREQLVEDFPEVPDYRNELASSLFNSAGAQKNLTEKLEMMSRAVDLRQSLVDNYPNIPDYKAKLAFSLQGLSMNQFAGGQPTESLVLYDRCIALYEQLHKDYPEVDDYRRNLLQSLDVQATMLRLANQLPRAEAALRRVVELQRQHLVAHPQDVGASIGLARAYEGIGKCYHKDNNYSAACDSYEQGLTVLESLNAVEESVAIVAKTAQGIRELRMIALDSAERFSEAAEAAEQIAANADAPLNWKIQAARYQALAGAHAAANEAALALLKDAVVSESTDHYNVACIFALSVAAASNDPNLSQADQERLIAEYLQHTLQRLKVAKSLGYFSKNEEIEHFQSDADFDAVRNTSELKSFSEQLRTDP